MARSKRDDMKRKIAQSVNHLAQSILDVNDVYLEFVAAAELMEKARERNHETPQSEEDGKHRIMADYLKEVMINTAMIREAQLQFARTAWDLDEDALMRYI